MKGIIDWFLGPNAAKQKEYAEEYRKRLIEREAKHKKIIQLSAYHRHDVYVVSADDKIVGRVVGKFGEASDQQWIIKNILVEGCTHVFYTDQLQVLLSKNAVCNAMTIIYDKAMKRFVRAIDHAPDFQRND